MKVYISRIDKWIDLKPLGDGIYETDPMILPRQVLDFEFFENNKAMGMRVVRDTRDLTIFDIAHFIEKFNEDDQNRENWNWFRVDNCPDNKVQIKVFRNQKFPRNLKMGILPAEKLRLYTVKFFNYDGSTFYVEHVNYTFNAVGPPEPPTRYGYTFTGWDQSLNYIESDRYIYAQYTINKYKVIFKDSDGTYLKNVMIEHGEKVSIPEQEPFKLFYDHVGWTDDINQINYVNRDLTIEPLWEPIEYFLNYKDWNGTLLHTEKLEHHRDARQEFSNPEKLCHKFTGWDRLLSFNWGTELNNIIRSIETTAQYEFTHHTWSDWSVVTPPTCLEEGLEKRLCVNNCGVHDPIETRPIPAIGHNEGVGVVTTAATCTAAGTTTFRCTHCNEVLRTTDVPEALEHTPETTVIDPTCTEEGTIITTCSRCEVELERTEIPSLGHNPGNKIDITQPTCIEDGIWEIRCTVCNVLLDSGLIEALGHDEDVGILVDKPTCLGDGMMVFSCTRCGVELRTETIPATGHDWTEWEIITPPTCTVDGMERRECLNDGCVYETRSIDSLGHVEGSDATCTEPKQCTRCGFIYQDALGHNYSWIVTTPANIINGAPGVESDKCIICEDVRNTRDILFNGFVHIELDDDRLIHGMSSADVAACCTTTAATSNITVGGITFRKNQVRRVRFGSAFNLTSLQRFGSNFNNLIWLSHIPNGITGTGCLNLFLFACISFNQPIEIPNSVTGDQCLTGFMQGCSSFNQPITIPSGVKGTQCLQSFLHSCVSFNHPMIIPEGVVGAQCLNAFMRGCISFNSPITIPNSLSNVTQISTFNNFLRDCTSFNQPIRLPSNLGGGNNVVSGLLHNCDSMVSDITIESQNVHLIGNNDTLSTTNELSPLYITGPRIIGGYSTLFKERFPNRDVEPFRRLR